MIQVRPMHRDDVPACVDLVNHIIALGGSTAYEEPFTEAGFAAQYLRKAPVSNVALAGARLVGFQAALDAGDGLYSVGTFTDRRNPVPGAGQALFRQTLADCRARGGVAILARITADNRGGLAFYGRRGFVDWRVDPAHHRRPDGRVVDRIVKRFDL